MLISAHWRRNDKKTGSPSGGSVITLTPCIILGAFSISLTRLARALFPHSGISAMEDKGGALWATTSAPLFWISFISFIHLLMEVPLVSVWKHTMGANIMSTCWRGMAKVFARFDDNEISSDRSSWIWQANEQGRQPSEYTALMHGVRTNWPYRNLHLLCHSKYCFSIGNQVVKFPAPATVLATVTRNWPLQNRECLIRLVIRWTTRVWVKLWAN